MFLRVQRGWVCLYYPATQVAASGDWRPKAILGLQADLRREGKLGLVTSPR